MASRGRAFWERLTREIEESGATITGVARRHGVSESALGYWKRRLHDEAKPAALLPVRVVGTGPHRLEIEAGGVRVVFDEGIEPAYVAAIARALRG